MSADAELAVFLDGYDAASPSGAALLAKVEEYLARFVAYPSEHCRVAHTLWIAHTHAMPVWESTPRIAFLSPEPGSGKTRALEITETLVPRPVEAINVSPAYLFRKVSDPAGTPTVLFDEIDTVFGPKAKDNEEIRGILNAGHRRGAMAGRCVMKGKTVETEELPAYCAVALAGLGNLPDTILTRSIIVRMQRRSPSERVEPYRRRLHAAAGNELRDKLANWASENILPGVYPAMPEGVEDRAADVWEPLLAIADAAGGAWPKRARAAAVALVRAALEVPPSLGVRLLADLRVVFGDREVVATEAILKELQNLDEAPWGDLKGKAIDPRRLANLLRPYGVASKNFRSEGRVVKGYFRSDLDDAWLRYLGPRHAQSPLQPLQPLHPTNDSGSGVADSGADVALDVADGPSPSLSNGAGCSAVADVARSGGDSRSCPDCDGRGCGTCGEHKRADGTPL